MQFLGMVAVQLKPSYYLAHTSIPAWCCVFCIYMAPTCQKNEFPTAPLFLGHTQEFKSLYWLLHVDPGSTLLSSVLCHQLDLSPATLPAKDRGHLMGLITLRFFNLLSALGKTTNCWIAFPKVIILFIFNLEHLLRYST